MAAFTLADISAETIERFWSKVQKGDGCWEWLGGYGNRGQTRFSVNHIDIPPQRFIWIALNGMPPDGLQVYRTCRNGRCVRPEHLAVGTSKEAVSRKHMMSHSPEYEVWGAILSRCFNKNTESYPSYGGRGITVCKRWQESFQNFYEDMGPRPTAKHSIDRKENNGHYSCGTCEQCVANGWPANCHWATMKVQSRNKRSNHKLTHNGETLTLMDWSIKTGIAFHTLSRRLTRGWTVEKALTTPSDTRFSEHWKNQG
jgi:hypothetical protein